MMNMKNAAFVIAFLVSAGTAAAAPWEPKGPESRRLLDDGRAAFKAGEYKRAATLFEAANAAEENLNAQWNAAQASAAAGDWSVAGPRYDRLLADPSLPKERRPEIERRQHVAARFIAAEYAGEAQKWDDARGQYLALLNDKGLGERDRATASIKLDELARQRAEAEAAERATPPETTVEAAPPPVESTSPPEPMPPPASRWDDWPALVMTTAGVASLGASIAFHLNASGLYDDAERSTDQNEIVSLRDRAGTHRTIGYVTLGVGAALTTIGVIKFIMVPSPGHGGVAIAPTPTAGGMVVSVGGSFW